MICQYGSIKHCIDISEKCPITKIIIAENNPDINLYSEEIMIHPASKK